LYTRGPTPLDFNDTNNYLQLPSPEIVYWLLNAAISGLVGNLTYDAIKGVIERAEQLHGLFIKLMPARRGPFVELTRLGSLDTDPPAELRDALITIAHETLQRYRQISPTGGKSPWSEIQVRFSRAGTWIVRLREAGEDNWTTIEIDLDKDPKATHLDGVANDDGFPVRIWY
jgi:hypothetical protein